MNQGATLLTSKELQCVARHLRHFVETCWKENHEEPDPCVGCQHYPECAETGTVTYHWKAFRALSNATSVAIRPIKERVDDYSSSGSL
jgi:hypothetical protein